MLEFFRFCLESEFWRKYERNQMGRRIQFMKCRRKKNCRIIFRAMWDHFLIILINNNNKRRKEYFFFFIWKLLIEIVTAFIARSDFVKLISYQNLFLLLLYMKRFYIQISFRIEILFFPRVISKNRILIVSRETPLEFQIFFLSLFSTVQLSSNY